jgi:hypothetical protein
VSKLANQWIELFRAGKQKDSNGVEREFTADDLDQMVANYQPSNPEYEEAPATIGHPEGTAPAWAWWEALKREGNLLLGKMKDIQPQFEEMVEQRMFPKRSIGLVQRKSGWNVQHVAFLGAKSPAVKGLADIKFASDDGSVKVEFEEKAMAQETATNDSIVAAVKAWFEEHFGAKPATATATFSEADVKRISGEVAAAAVEAAVKPLKTQLDASEAKFAARETALVTVEQKNRGEAAIAGLKAKGRWVPAFDKMGIPLVFAALATQATTVEFEEGGEKKQVSPLDLLVKFMESGKALVPTGQVYNGQQATGAAGDGMKGVNAGRATVDPNSARLHAAVAEFSEKNKVTYAEALFKVAAEHPELTVPGGAAVGQA